MMVLSKSNTTTMLFLLLLLQAMSQENLKNICLFRFDWIFEFVGLWMEKERNVVWYLYKTMEDFRGDAIGALP